jgi:hypothetical protein
MNCFKKRLPLTCCIILLFACKAEQKHFNLPTFKNLQLYSTEETFNRFADSLIRHDNSFRIARDGNIDYCEFTENSTYGLSYYGYVVPTYTNGIITKVIVFYTPSSSPSTISSSIRREKTLVFWGDKVNQVLNDLTMKLQIKYGSKFISEKRVAEHTYFINHWQKDDVSIRLVQEVDADDNSNKFPFCNLFIEYTATESFKQ